MTLRFNLRSTIVFALLSLVAPLSAQNPSPIFSGVTKVWSNGGIGPVTGIPGMNTTGLVSGDNDTKPPGLFAVMGSLGSGHAIAIGHASLFANTANGSFDTLRFNTQTISWLDQNNTKVVGITSGHGERKKISAMSTLTAALTTAGYQVRTISGTVSSTKLAGVGCVIVGNAWSKFGTTELTVFENYVKSGGGMYLGGTGWSWEAYNTTLPQYPMNILGARFGISWLGGTMKDATNNQSGSPIFTRFYPNCGLYLPDTALQHLQALVAGHPNDLNSYLRGNASARTDFLIAVQQASAAQATAPETNGVRALFDTRMRTFLRFNQKWFGANGRWNPSTDAHMANARAVLHANLGAAFPLDPVRIGVISQTIGLNKIHPDYLEILNKYQVMLLDNRSLDIAQRQAVKDVLENVKDVPKVMKRITIKHLYGTVTPDIRTSIVLKGVNIFGTAITSTSNGFPKDMAPRKSPSLLNALVHEVTHSIDAALKNGGAWEQERNKLLADAGLVDLQYLRSANGGAFFQKSPQEFVASMSNQFMVDSLHTFRLGMQRHRAGYHEPIRQALFMLDMYAQGRATAPLFDAALSGRQTVKPASVSYDSSGRIVLVRSPDVSMRAVYDTAGKVSKVSAVLAYGEDSGTASVKMGGNGGPFMGNSLFRLEGTAPAPSQPGFLFVGPWKTDQVLPSFVSRGHLLVNPTAAAVVGIASDAQSKLDVAVPIPNVPSLLHQKVYAQALMQRSSPTAGAWFETSRGLELWIGAQ